MARRRERLNFVTPTRPVSLENLKSLGRRFRNNGALRLKIKNVDVP
jgi:hypothetical protein